ncbi:two-component regulator propeller domain-containing protein [Cytophagaceae bacterium DM2B3-1]|uniref:Two-component regulator propeller domain-containing protein n=1 Tax=Xanthocytophaga flava TaxID=3048013 RepID=A0ABT7CJV7_9BACT|nr:two-component regulator propeller domain-containing protein [Xanthocytophaga flavus]MDJ1469477.1 two-component regulator propeller domain-containing protein [Xanthocytophaga flavus]MDJ1494011.1 two-component regulator propeller domain-containing protein [Xanthocytophaga flavus]
MRRKLWLFFIIIQSVSFGQKIETICKPEILNFTKQTYNAYHQNWGITQESQTRFMYFANSKGLIEYDGNHWEVYELPNKQKVRSAVAGIDGRIYTGGLGEFGYWQSDKTGKLTYHSLKALINDPSFAGEEIWNILPTSEGILFQSFAFIYLYQNNKITNLSPPGNIMFAYQINGRVLLGVIDKGLYEFKHKSFSFIDNSSFLGKESVNTILPGRDQTIVIGTNRGIYLYDGNDFQPFNTTTNAFLLQNQLNRGVMLNDTTYAFGTILNGIVITNTQGEIIQHLNQKNGLQNNTILSLYKDADGNLWSGMDKGISLILINSPLRYYQDYDGHLGTVYDIALFEKKLYLGTNHGLFVSNLQSREADFQLVPKTQGQVWDLEVIDNQLLCGHNNGTFLIEGTQAKQISSVTGGWIIRKLKKHPDLLLQGTYTQLCIYKKNASFQWELAHTVSGFSAPVNQLEEDDFGYIWVNKVSKGLNRIKLSADTQKMDSIWSYETPELKSAAVNLCQINKRVIVTTNQQVLQFDPDHNVFEPATNLQKQLGADKARKFFPINPSASFVLKTDGTLGFIEKDNSIKEIPMKKFQWFDDYENLVSIDNRIHLICLENGFGVLPENLITSLLSSTIQPPVIRSIVPLDFPTLGQTFRTGDNYPAFAFNYNQNSLIISFSTPHYSNEAKYSFWLENSSKGWSNFQTMDQKEFNNLAPGKYIFHLRSNLSKKETQLEFEILSPWYWNQWSISIYVLTLIGAGIFSYWLHLQRVKAHQERVRRKLEKKLRKQEEESQKEIIQLRNQQLEQDVIRKSEELANSTMTLIKKNELLLQIKQEVLDIKTELGSKSNSSSFKEIIHLLESNISTDHDWQIFESNFNRVHEEFLQKLIHEYPTLTPSDLRLAAYLRMNLSTKEIAQLFNITYRSVELKRYRLRKKMNLDTDVNLGEFMMKYTNGN